MTKLSDLIGRRARLLYRIDTRGGESYARGLVVEIFSVWRGRFTLASTDEPKRIIVRHVSRNAVKVLG